MRAPFLPKPSRGLIPKSISLKYVYTSLLARHNGGNKNADAQVGVLGYRTMLECKTAKPATTPTPSKHPNTATLTEAQFCALIGPSFTEEIQLASELQTHKVAPGRSPISNAFFQSKATRKKCARCSPPVSCPMPSTNYSTPRRRFAQVATAKQGKPE